MNIESRTINATKNIFWGYIASIARIALEFVLRTIFIYQIGSVYLGINGLYTNVLGMLSLSELGIGTSMSYSLYKPIATGDTEKIKSLMLLFKKAYRIIAFTVAIIGLCIVPFLSYIITNADNISHSELIIFYLIYLFNTVTSYFVSYKYSLVTAYQKSYIITKLEMIFKCITIVTQAIMLIIFKSFLAYLLSQAVIGLLQKIISAIYIDKKYVFLRDKNVQPVDEEDKKVLKDNVKGSLVHKIGEVAIYQTDSIIISAFISTALVGYVSNYTLIINAIATFTNAIFNSLISGYGNFIAKESKEKQEEMLYINQFLAFVVYGFVTICMYILIQPFISLWLGQAQKIDDISCALLMVNIYFSGERLMLNNYKVAAGIFLQDRWVTILRSITNIVLSLALVNILGLSGVYIGTLLQGILGNIFEPRIVCKNMFGKSGRRYYLNSIKYILSVFIPIVALTIISYNIMTKVTITRFIILFFISIVVIMIVYFVFYAKNQYNRFILSKAKRLLKKG